MLAIPFVVKNAWSILDKFLPFTNRCCLTSSIIKIQNATQDNHPMLVYCLVIRRTPKNRQTEDKR